MKKLGAFCLLICTVSILRAEPLIDFPTDNHALAGDRPQDFFMFVHRDFEGRKFTPWQGGQYGYVRTPRRSAGEIFYTHLHEGVDIRAQHRGPDGEPLDEVRAAADGTVVHISPRAGASNYGRYVVVEHRWDGCRYYTLYAHLASIAVESGQSVRQGETLGVLGHSGAGLDCERAHVHFEVCVLLSENFNAWYAAHIPSTPNRHGIYNGLNFAGTDPARLLLAARRNPNLKITDVIAAIEPYFSIVINNSPDFSLIRDYPWLVPPGEAANPPAWKVTCSRTGFPLKVEAVSQRVAEPVAVWVKNTPYPTRYATRGYVTGSPAAPRLTDSGMRFARLLTWPD